MRAANREYFQLYALSIALTALLAIAPAAALLGPAVTQTSLSAAQSQLIHVERGISYALFAGFLLLLFWRIRPKRSASAAADEANAPVPNETPAAAPTPGGRTDSVLRYIAVVLPALPLLIYLWQYSGLAYASLFLGDQDFTNISVALNTTARGDGLLFTPYLSTGPSGSYLGHHFSPALLLYVPVYWLVDFFSGAGLMDRPTHFVYAVVLWSTLALGLALWGRLFQKEIRSTFGAVLVMALLCGAYPLWRLALSFHYELPVLPLSALFFLSLGSRRQQPTGQTSLWFYVSLLLWLSVKEDIALYLILFGAYLCAHRGESPHSSTTLHLARGLTVIVVATTWVALALWGMDTIGGSERVDWIAAWREPDAPVERSVRPGLLLLLATGGLALLNLRLFALVLLPILTFHLLSRQIWHHSFLGHYSYAVLPFLFFATLRGWQRLEAIRETVLANNVRGFAAAAGLVVLGCSFAAAAGDRYMPMPAPAPDADRAQIAQLLRIPKSGDCVQTQWHFSAHAPLDLRVYPLIAPENNPARESMPGPHSFAEFHFGPYESEDAQRSAARCGGAYYLLLDRTRPLPPVYTQTTLDAFADFAVMNLERVHGGDPGSLELYRLRRLD